jgi:hypothetical protein
MIILFTLFNVQPRSREYWNSLNAIYNTINHMDACAHDAKKLYSVPGQLGQLDVPLN